MMGDKGGESQSHMCLVGIRIDKGEMEREQELNRATYGYD